jgi:putative hydrolase of the HAD superfamily
MANQSIKAVLFDYGGVIAEEGFRNGLLAMAHEQGLDIDATLNVAKQAVYDSGFVLGWGTASEFWTIMREGCGLKGSDSVLTQRILEGFVLRPWIIELVQQLHEQGYITGILSDQTHWLDWLNERDHFYDVFDHVFNSYNMGKGKRDPGLFNDIAEQLVLSPAEILFVDDIENNVARAQSAGWQTIHYMDKLSFLEMIDKLLLPGIQDSDNKASEPMPAS